ncbi:Os03g0388950 [Oryza sativa Japonica Group]|uniref:Os03g0388950 protein n=2 Tax=Oryza sativa subsp. japonica TaxID=39947 RepID=B9F8T0_ORYSJ|nr:hypothetical protein OsJ_11105 [Oryza sativa Japonica Group]BAS84502.1 Os03g0388950 [Oryza sativa Japonica Group]
MPTLLKTTTTTLLKTTTTLMPMPTPLKTTTTTLLKTTTTPMPMPMPLKTTTTMATGSRRRRTRTSAVEIAGIKQQASVAGEPPSVSLVILSALPSATSACIFISKQRAYPDPQASRKIQHQAVKSTDKKQASSNK